MQRRHIRLGLVLLIGVMAPYVWVSSLGFWALYVYGDAARLIWNVFSIKGTTVFVALDVVHSLLIGVAISLPLRVLCKREWRVPATLFSVGFLMSFYVIGLAQSSNMEEVEALVVLSLVGVSILLVTVAAASAALARYPRQIDG